KRVNKKGGAPFDTKVYPSRLGHIVHFTTDVDRKIDFYTRVLGLKLTDRSGDFIAFLRVPGGSDHHVIAVIKGDKPGIHHTSFEVNNIDEMGIAGQRMMDKGYRNGWGIGRHALGSNFFWYIRDPHNGLAEYFSDIDYISDDRKWRARDWPMEVSFFLWGPPPPAEFGRNFEGTRKTTKPKPLVLSRT
ncbi:MAG TPA: dioxygenase, partial [Gammaproteobacteria bacterium]|nr:dioxygenase [Gammaproteobacteria bacterium]